MPNFDNADYFFESTLVVAELKEIETEFGRAKAFHNKFGELMRRLIAENPTWRPALLGGSGRYPPWFHSEFVRIFRPPVSCVLKKANRQIRDTKKYLEKIHAAGVLIFVNDGLTMLGPDIIHGLACSILKNSYSSIDCFIYLTVNRCVEIKESDVPRLVWIPTYGNHADESLHQFVNDLGRKWFKFLSEKIGPFTIDHHETESIDVIRGSKAILLPDESRS